MLKSITEYRVQNKNLTGIELQAMLERMSERIEYIQLLTTSYYEEATSKYEENKQQLNRMNIDMNSKMDRVFGKLNQISETAVILSNVILKIKKNMEQ